MPLAERIVLQADEEQRHKALITESTVYRTTAHTLPPGVYSITADQDQVMTDNKRRKSVDKDGQGKTVVTSVSPNTLSGTPHLALCPTVHHISSLMKDP